MERRNGMLSGDTRGRATFPSTPGEEARLLFWEGVFARSSPRPFFTALFFGPGKLPGL